MMVMMITIEIRSIVTFMMIMKDGWMNGWMDEYGLCDIACDHADGYDEVDYDVNGEKQQSTVNCVGYILSVILFISVMMMMMICVVLYCVVVCCVVYLVSTCLYMYEYVG